MGYHRAGFEVVGVDIKPQPNYPFRFVQMDALDALKIVAANPIGWAAIHASPPCQAHSKARRLRKNIHPHLIADTRIGLRATGLPWVIENVIGAALKRERILLCGSQFAGLKTRRHRFFEGRDELFAPTIACNHSAKLAKLGRPVKPGEWIDPTGNFSDVDFARTAMGVPWMTREEIREAIPPAFTEFIGKQLLNALSLPAQPARGEA